MAELRKALSAAGFQDVRTYLQSGNVVMRSELPAPELAAECEALISERFGLDVPVLARTGAELAEVIRRDPLAGTVDEPKSYQVTFLERDLSPDQVVGLQALVVAPERLVARGREIYTWHPSGIARSALAAALASARLGVKATARNWSTVTKLDAITRGG
jgi:uncharacterized protein (DUF1697 family)